MFVSWTADNSITIISGDEFFPFEFPFDIDCEGETKVCLLS